MADFPSHPPATLLRTTPQASKPASIRALVTFYQIASSLRKWKSGIRRTSRQGSGQVSGSAYSAAGLKEIIRVVIEIDRIIINAGKDRDLCQRPGGTVAGQVKDMRRRRDSACAQLLVKNVH